MNTCILILSNFYAHNCMLPNVWVTKFLIFRTQVATNFEICVQQCVLTAGPSSPHSSKIGISNARTPQPDRGLDSETLLVKLQLGACNSRGVVLFIRQMTLNLLGSFKRSINVDIKLVSDVYVENLPGYCRQFL